MKKLLIKLGLMRAVKKPDPPPMFDFTTKINAAAAATSPVIPKGTYRIDGIHTISSWWDHSTTETVLKFHQDTPLKPSEHHE